MHLCPKLVGSLAWIIFLSICNDFFFIFLPQMLSTLPKQKYFMSLQEAIAVLEIFITGIKKITKARNRAPITDEIETRRGSTFKVAIAFEEFALKYSKLHLTGTRSSQVIDSQTMGEFKQRIIYRPWWCSKLI